MRPTRCVRRVLSRELLGERTVRSPRLRGEWRYLEVALEIYRRSISYCSYFINRRLGGFWRHLFSVFRKPVRIRLLYRPQRSLCCRYSRFRFLGAVGDMRYQTVNALGIYYIGAYNIDIVYFFSYTTCMPDSYRTSGLNRHSCHQPSHPRSTR